MRLHPIQNIMVMKTKSLLQLTFILTMAVASFYMLERKRQTRNSSIINETYSHKSANEIHESINDFIFLEAVSKYLFVAIPK